jgi:hypothetical protein
MNPFALAADKITAPAPNPAETDADADTECFELLVELALADTPAARQLPRRRILHAIRRADDSMGWPKNDFELHPDQDTSRMIDETLRRASENLRAELERTDSSNPMRQPPSTMP